MADPVSCYNGPMNDVEVLWLTEPEQIAQAVGVAARSLQDGPDSRAVSDDPLVRLEMLYSTFAGLLDGARVAAVRRGGCILGVASAVEPGHCVAAHLPPEARTLVEPPGDASDADRFLHFGSILAAHDLDEPHWHVGPVGVEPGFQSMGMGRSAMRLLCAEFDEHARVAWLETAKPENVRFYIGLGFEVVEESPMLSAHLWFMRREPA
jgi:ribosomal protein S18 acetylase RimI-like enzyme